MTPDEMKVGFRTRAWSGGKETLWPMPGPQWQPIETAPKEHGTRLLVFAPSDIVAVATKMSEWWEIEPISADDYYANKIEPTHWMPLPAPPVERLTQKRFLGEVISGGRYNSKRRWTTPDRLTGEE